MNQASALNTYKTIGVQTGVTDASPHQMISMLLKGAIDRIASAKGAVSQNNVTAKGELIGKAIAIVDSLRASLDHQKGGEISVNLNGLYDYIERLLLEANLNSDMAKLEEASGLLKEIQSGWDAIPAEYK